MSVTVRPPPHYVGIFVAPWLDLGQAGGSSWVGSYCNVLLHLVFSGALMSWQAVTIFAALSFVLLQSPAVFAQTSSPERIALWNGRAPIGEGRFEAADAWLSIYRPERPSGAAAIICPGGGYRGLDLEAEGADVAKWLTRNGIAGLVLEYRLPHGR